MLTGIDHGSAALGAGLVVPRPYAVAAAIQADTSHQRCKRRGRVANDSTDNQWLDSLAIRTADSLYMLAHKPTALIVVSLIAALLTSVCFSLRHYFWNV